MIFHANHFTGSNTSYNSPDPVSLRCPNCRQQGTFEAVAIPDLALTNEKPPISLGQRRCPNPECRAHIFVARQGKTILVSYPAERIDFDSTNIPEAVIKSLEEAITCHANQCFIASAIMVRKTLEQLCDASQVTGNNLKERIKQLGTKVVLPQELLEGLDDLRLLGNDAAHIESQVYNQVGKEEVEVGIEFTKEVLKSVYQLSALLNRLRALKKQPNPK